MENTPPTILREMFEAAVRAAQPAHCLPPALPDAPQGQTIVVGAGKAAAAMAQVFEANWQSSFSGTVVTPYGHSLPCETISVLEAAHPVPDQASLAAAQQILAEVESAGPNDLVIVLLSGGGSSLLTLPGPGLTLGQKIALNRELLASGAPISAINTVRKHLSAIKGGRLARAAHPARVVTLAISDVPGDDPATIASGPTVGDPTTLAMARQVLSEFGLTSDPQIQEFLSDERNETAKPDLSFFDPQAYRLIATPQLALDAAAAVGRAAGYNVEFLGDAIEGEARDVATQHARLARELSPGTLLLSGGELTVTITGDGQGGPNTEYLLSLANALDSAVNIHALAADTDGQDGSGDNAGAWITPTTLARATAQGVNPAAHLARNDAYGFFSGIENLLITGPTHTNVNDFRVILRENP